MKIVKHLLFLPLIFWQLLKSIWNFFVKLVEYSNEQRKANYWRHNIEIGDDCYFYSYNGEKVSGTIHSKMQYSDNAYFVSANGRVFSKDVFDLYPA